MWYLHTNSFVHLYQGCMRYIRGSNPPTISSNLTQLNSSQVSSSKFIGFSIQHNQNQSDAIQLNGFLFLSIRFNSIQVNFYPIHSSNLIQLKSIPFNSIMLTAIQFDSIKFDSTRFNSFQFHPTHFDSIQLNSAQLIVWTEGNGGGSWVPEHEYND